MLLLFQREAAHLRREQAGVQAASCAAQRLVPRPGGPLHQRPEDHCGAQGLGACVCVCYATAAVLTLCMHGTVRCGANPCCPPQVSYCGSSEQDVLYINERQVMVRSKSMYNDCNPNPNLEGVQCDFSKRYVCLYVCLYVCACVLYFPMLSCLWRSVTQSFSLIHSLSMSFNSIPGP